MYVPTTLQSWSLPYDQAVLNEICIIELQSTRPSQVSLLEDIRTLDYGGPLGKSDHTAKEV